MGHSVPDGKQAVGDRFIWIVVSIYPSLGDGEADEVATPAPARKN